MNETQTEKRVKEFLERGSVVADGTVIYAHNTDEVAKALNLSHDEAVKALHALTNAKIVYRFVTLKSEKVYYIHKTKIQETKT